MKFIIEYGCEICTEHLAVEANCIESALTYAEGEAMRLRESYEGLHGVVDYDTFCEEYNYDTEDETAWEEYMDMVRYELHYCAEDFDELNEDHVSILKDCGGEFFPV